MKGCTEYVYYESFRRKALGQFFAVSCTHCGWCTMSAGNKEEEAELNIDQLDTTGFWTHQDEISQTSANKK